MGVDTHRVEVVPVVLEKHPDADSLSVVRVYNFTVVVRTADWEGVGLGAYVQPDSVLPDKLEYRFLKETGNLKREREELRAKMEAEHESDLARLDYEEKLRALEAKIDANTKRLRITVQKLRGIISMGMLLPAPEGSAVGDDVADVLGVTHYEPPTMDEIEGRRQHAGDDIAPAPPMIYAPKYDVESVYKYADCFDPGEMVYVSEKLDGQNARYVATAENDRYEDRPSGRVRVSDVVLHAGSRTEWKKREGGSELVEGHRPEPVDRGLAGVQPRKGPVRRGVRLGAVAQVRGEGGPAILPRVRHPRRHGVPQRRGLPGVAAGVPQGA